MPRSTLRAEMQRSEEQLLAGRRIGGLWTASFLVVDRNRNEAKKGTRWERNAGWKEKCRRAAGFALLSACAVLCVASSASAPMLGHFQGSLLLLILRYSRYPVT